MSLTTVVTGNTIYATDINQTINVLQQPSGGQERGKYFLGGTSTAYHGTISQYMSSLSRGSTPSSVTIDTTDFSPQSVDSPLTSHLTSNGVQVYALCNVSGGAYNCNVAGNLYFNY